VSGIALPYFLAEPEGDGPRQGVVVLHEGGGISPQLLRVTQRFAAAGYVAIAPDLFFRSGGTRAADYRVLMGALVPDQVVGDIKEVADVLRAHGAERVAVMGFCMGGQYTWHTALHGAGFAAAVGFYGAGISDDLGTPRCPTLLFFGGQDPFVAPEDVARVAAHHPATVVYPDAGHGFMRDGTDAYRSEEAQDAWSRTLAFLAEHLSN
jgi:carboxymethylenebutenolidase